MRNRNQLQLFPMTSASYFGLLPGRPATSIAKTGAFYRGHPQLLPGRPATSVKETVGFLWGDQPKSDRSLSIFYPMGNDLAELAILQCGPGHINAHTAKRMWSHVAQITSKCCLSDQISNSWILLGCACTWSCLLMIGSLGTLDAGLNRAKVGQIFQTGTVALAFSCSIKDSIVTSLTNQTGSVCDVQLQWPQT